MPADTITANLPSRDFGATSAFYRPLSFETVYRDDAWMILRRDGMVVEFFAHPDLDPKASWFSACMRVDDLDALFRQFAQVGLSDNPRDIPRLTPPTEMGPGLRGFALVDPDGSLWRCFQNEIAA